MPSAQNCPSCGSRLSADAPEGLCAACLLKAGLDGLLDEPDFGDPISIPPRREPVMQIPQAPPPPCRE